MKFNQSLLITAMALFAASGLIAKNESKKAEAPGVAPQPAEFFYTGKPYDADLGAYTFNYRNYDPELKRWTSMDPSGFPDGVNNNIYIRNNSTFALDSTGLQTFTYTAQKFYYNGVDTIESQIPSSTTMSTGSSQSSSGTVNSGQNVTTVGGSASLTGASAGGSWTYNGGTSSSTGGAGTVTQGSITYTLQTTSSTPMSNVGMSPSDAFNSITGYSVVKWISYTDSSSTQLRASTGGDPLNGTFWMEKYKYDVLTWSGTIFFE